MATLAKEHKFDDVLLHRELVTRDQLDLARAEARETSSRLERILVEQGILHAEDLVLALASYLDITPINLKHFTPTDDLMELAPKEMLQQHLLVPLHRTTRTLTVAMGDPFDVVGIDELQSLTGLHVMTVVAPENQINDLLQKALTDAAAGLEDILRDVTESDDVELGTTEAEEVSLDEMLESAEDAPVVRLVNSIMLEAIRKRASDIHIEPMERMIRLRYRIDGMLYESPSPPKNLQQAISSRLKIMSNLDIAERRIPQDGRFRIRALGKEADIRLSMLPTVHGEKVVMRILDKSALATSLESLGLDDLSYRDLKFAISQPHGMLLVTGPTGSGKTTTLYSALQELNQPDRNIITVEDPVEYQLMGINQVQTHSDVGLTFAAGLRSILRQDPDIVMIGEIRDGETAAIAVQAALTGHLVLSTLHTNDAAGAIARMNYMGVEPFLIASSLCMAQAQRLFRKLCPNCKKARALPEKILKTNMINPELLAGGDLFEANGCPKCGQTGYKGRGALMEILLVNDEIRALVLANANSTAIRDAAQKAGMKTLREVGLERVRDGVTSIEEILRVSSGH